jgi:hypothetical protein
MDYEQQLIPGLCTPGYLEILCEDASKRRGPQLSLLQMSAMGTFSDEIPTMRNMVEKASVTDIITTGDLIHLKYLLSLYFAAFDKLFFFGSLQCCTLNLTPEFETLCMGTCGYDPSSGKVIITLYNFAETTFEDRMRRYLSTLLHEMVHAFLYKRQYFHHHPNYIGHGYTGHGMAWQDIAYVVEQAANDPTLLGLQLDLNRATSLAFEMLYIEKCCDITDLEEPGMFMDPARWGLERCNEETKGQLRILWAKWEKSNNRFVVRYPPVSLFS